MWLCGCLAFTDALPAELDRPPNDDLTNAFRIELPGGAPGGVVLAGTNHLATLEPGEAENPAIQTGQGMGTIWWRWIAPGAGAVQVGPFARQTETLLGVFTGDTSTNLVTVVAPDPTLQSCDVNACWHSGLARFRARGGQTYLLGVMGYPGSAQAEGAVTGAFSFEPLPGLANDFFEDRTVLTGTTVTVDGDNGLATLEAGEPTSRGGVVLMNSLWYTWTAPFRGLLRARVVSASSLGVTLYRGDRLDALQPLIGPAADTGFIEVLANEPIQIAVDSMYYPVWGGGGQAGAFTLSLAASIPDPTSRNDAFADALALPEVPFVTPGNLRGANREPGEPMGTYADGGPETLWWSFRPTRSGALTLETEATGWSPRLVAYRGSSLASLVVITTLDSPSGQMPLTFRVEPDQSYFIQCTRSTGGGAAGEFALRSVFDPAPANDDFAARLLVEGTNCTVNSWFLDATVQPGEPLPAPTTTRTLWWSWVAPANGRAKVQPRWIIMADRYGVGDLSVFTGPAVDQLVPVPGRRLFRESPLIFAATAGTHYHIQLAPQAEGFEPTGFDVSLTPFTAATNDDFADALVVDGEWVTSLVSLKGATREPGEPPHRPGSPNRSVWWRWSAPRNGEQAAVRLAYDGTLTNVTFAVYQGASLETLQLVAKGDLDVRFSCRATEVYYVAAEIDAAIEGDLQVDIFTGPPSPSVHEIPGNRVSNASFENLGASGWPFVDWSGDYGGGIDGVGPDGRNCAMLGWGDLWQDVATIPGRSYRLRFAYASESGGLEARFGGQVLGAATVAEGPPNRWLNAEFIVTAPGTISRLEFRGQGNAMSLDQVSLVALDEPPQWVTAPESLHTFAGATVAFRAGATGAEPMYRQWYHDDQPLAGAHGALLWITNATPADAGRYFIVVTNAYGAITSPPVTLTVEVPAEPQIVLQPAGDLVFAGQYVVLRVAAVGEAPLTYQWLRDGVWLPDATGDSLVFPRFTRADAGTYTVLVANGGGSTLSLPATLRLNEGTPAASGLLHFANFDFGLSPLLAPVFDVDGLTRLAGPGFVAQLYVGPSPETLRAVGEPRPFQSGIWHGFWEPVTLTVPLVDPGQPALVQARAWDRSVAASYEAARALGGRFGRSETFPVVFDPAALAWQVVRLEGLRSFQLQAGLPGFTTGRLELAGQDPDGVMTWRLQGAAGFRYLVERRTDGAGWRPLVALTNETGTVTFTDSRDPAVGMQMYRARLLD